VIRCVVSMKHAGNLNYVWYGCIRGHLTKILLQYLSCLVALDAY
jgi:hypothetical protein